MTETKIRRYRTRIPQPDAKFFDMTNPQVRALMIERCEQHAEAVADGDEVVLTFEATDLYELAMSVRELQDDLQSEGFHYRTLEIGRPTPVRAQRRRTTKI